MTVYQGSIIKLYPFKDILHYKILEYIKIVIKILINNTFTNLNIDSDNDNNLIDNCDIYDQTKIDNCT